jgi:hypothetical protein
VNSTGYQDGTTFLHWLTLFIAWKKEWLQAHNYKNDQNILILLDGHYFHLDSNVLYTAAMNHITLLCLPAHSTSITQPNDKTTNLELKRNLDKVIASALSNGCVIEGHDVAYYCEQALMLPNINTAIVSSFQQCGVYPLDCDRLLKNLQKYQIQKQSDEVEAMVTQAVSLVSEKYETRIKEIEKKQQRKEDSMGITFTTKSATVLTSSTLQARVLISKEWTSCNNLRKADLFAKMREFGFAQSQTEGKTIPQLKEMIKVYLTSKVESVVNAFEEELKKSECAVPATIRETLRPSSAQPNHQIPPQPQQPSLLSLANAACQLLSSSGVNNESATA